ncbi:MAG: metallophosphoesterase [Paracoccaceae bacterium]|nr:metallophosphoesterase [Paracoccaceae bacterium]
MAILLVYYLRSNSTFYPVKLFVYEGMGIGFISLFVVTIGFILSHALPIAERTIGYLSISIIFTLFIISRISTILFSIKEVNLRSDKISENHCLAFISDIHLGSNDQNHLKRIISKIIRINPKILLIGGDLIDGSSFKTSDLGILKALKIPIYFVTGNHEYYLKDANEKLDSLKEYGIKTIDNQNIFYDNINIIGISDNISDHEKIKYVQDMVKPGSFNLCIVHQPSIWENIWDDVDMMLSGHTHKGQIFPFYFLVKLKFKYIYGVYKTKNSTLCVSSGAGTWGPRMRLGSVNEIVKINLHKHK